MKPVRFGTDGWRAVIADSFTFDNLARAAQATADCWKTCPPQGTHPLAVVGYDRRFLSPEFARCVAEILCGNGFEVVMSSQPVPTPALALAVKQKNAVGGIMITASHNPARYNGFKVKAWYGGSADKSICRSIEDQLDRNPVQRMELAEARGERRIQFTNLRENHYRAIRSQIDFQSLNATRLKLAHDALHGVGAGCFEELLKDTRCRVTGLRGSHDPNFGGLSPEPVERNYGATSRWLRQHPHDLCLVTDGDADRIGAMDGRGRALSTHQLICLLISHLVNRRKGKGRVVKALTTTSMVDKICAEFGLPLTESPVGFKHISSELLKPDVLLGAEESGGIGFPGHLPERDGLLAGLMLVEMLAVEGVSINRLLARLTRRYGPHCYEREDLGVPIEEHPGLIAKCAENPPARLGRSPVDSVRTFDGVKYIAKDGSWLMVRGFGTEPLLRVYAEAGSQDACRRLIGQGRRLIRLLRNRPGG